MFTPLFTPLLLLCMQDGRTALERAVDGGYHTVVDYLVIVNQMDVTQFDIVCNTICVCVYVYK